MRPVSAALPSDEVFRPRRRTGARWVLALAAVSFAGGVIARDRVSFDLLDRARSQATLSKNWIADRVDSLRGMIGTGSPSSHQASSPPVVETSTSPTVVDKQAMASHPGSQGVQPGSVVPPEVNVLSLPVAPPTAAAVAPKPIARSPVALAPANPPVPVHARSTPTPATEAPEAAPEPAPKAPEPQKVAAPTAAPVGNVAPVAPGSLEDLIRKEVEKEQKKAR